MSIIFDQPGSFIDLTQHTRAGDAGNHGEKKQKGHTDQQCQQ
jgi:hypothetical protein